MLLRLTPAQIDLCYGALFLAGVIVIAFEDASRSSAWGRAAWSVAWATYGVTFVYLPLKWSEELFALAAADGLDHGDVRTKAMFFSIATTLLLLIVPTTAAIAFVGVGIPGWLDLALEVTGLGVAALFVVCLWSAAQALASADKAGERLFAFGALLFLFIGIWYLRPRVNRLRSIRPH